MNLKQQSKLSILITLKSLSQLVCKNINEWVEWLYCHVEKWTNHKMNTKSITRRISKGKRQPIFSRGSCACQHAMSPLCRPTLGGSAAKRCFTNLVHTIGHRKNLLTSEVTQCHEQFTRVTFWHSAGEGTTPLTITEGGHEQSPTHADPSPLLQQAKSTAQHEYQVPLDAITQAMHLDSLPIS